MKHILIGSARKEVSKLFEMLLWASNRTFSNAYTLDACLKQIKTSPPDLWVVDGEIGASEHCFNVLVEIKESPATEKLPIVVLNDPVRDGEEKSRLLLVADGHIPEPFNPDEIKTVVEQFV